MTKRVALKAYLARFQQEFEAGHSNQVGHHVMFDAYTQYDQLGKDQFPILDHMQGKVVKITIELEE